MNPKVAQIIQKAPQEPGIYAFKNKKDGFLYIGKAANLRNRLKQYSNRKAPSPFMKNMAEEAEELEIKKTDSEIEALILESRLIKKHQPKYNIMLRDGKQYFYVAFTNEEFSKIFITHQPNSKYRNIEISVVGPFTDGTALKTALRLLRKIFPFCSCKQKHNNFCLNYHIGKCPGHCCLKQVESSIKYKVLSIYKKNIKAVKEILSGKKESAIKNLKKELILLGKKQEFEKAIELRNKIGKLEKIFANAKIILNTEYLIPETESAAKIKAILEKLAKIFRLPRLPSRIEGYDVSNIQGKNAVGAMAVFTSGLPDKNEYRKFKIIFKKSPDDIAMLKEIISRRLNHPEWPYPDLIFIDGGIAQLNIAVRMTGGKFPVISLAKGRQEIFSSTFKKPVQMKKIPKEVQNLIRQIDSEAHKFAVSYYRKLHRKTVFE